MQDGLQDQGVQVPEGRALLLPRLPVLRRQVLQQGGPRQRRQLQLHHGHRQGERAERVGRGRG